MELKDVQDFIDFVAKSGVSEVKLEMDNLKLTVRNNVASSNDIITTKQARTVLSEPDTSPKSTSGDVVDTIKEDLSATIPFNTVVIKSPMIGTFYRRPSPEEDVFVNIGDTVDVGSAVCMIEAMKLFNKIESEVSGRIVKILVDDNTAVEYDQDLFLVEVR